jgi:hypothetical protein
VINNYHVKSYIAYGRCYPMVFEIIDKYCFVCLKSILHKQLILRPCPEILINLKSSLNGADREQ